MKYNQPYGVSDPNASYINGDPSIGRAGSIPPAESIEMPQREIANLISDVGFTPTNSDLHQLGKGIQTGKLNYSNDFGTANAYVAHLTPTPDDYYTGMTVKLKIGNNNAGDSTLAIFPLTPKHCVRPDGTNLQLFDLIIGQIATFVYDGTQFVLASSNAGGSGGPIYLVAPRTYYVNASTGNDAYDGLSATVVNATNGPFLTLQKASDAVAKFNLNGFSVNVFVADGVYATVRLPGVGGQGSVNWIGNPVTPQNVVISGGSNVLESVCVIPQGLANAMNGFRLTTAGTYGNGIAVGSGALLYIKNFDFGPQAGQHMQVFSGGSLRLDGNGSDTFRITGSAPGNAFNPGCFLSVFAAGHVDIVNVSTPPPLVIPNPISMATAFVQASDVGVVQMLFSSITGAANVTGKKFNAVTNGVINTGGGGVNYLPGTIAGTTSSGGQYI